MQELRLPICDSCGSCRGSLASTVTKLQRLKPQNCDSNWSCKLDREETAKAQVVGQYENAVNTVQIAGAAKKVLAPRQTEAQHLINIKTEMPAVRGRSSPTPLTCRPRRGVEILFGVSAKQCRDHHPKKLPPIQFRVFAEIPPQGQDDQDCLAILLPPAGPR